MPFMKNFQSTIASNVYKRFQKVRKYITNVCGNNHHAGTISTICYLHQGGEPCDRSDNVLSLSKRIAEIIFFA